MIRGRMLMLAAVALAAGCSSPWPVDRFEAPEANLAGRHSFTWKAGELATPLTRRPEVAAELEAQVRQAVAEELLNKGYVEAPDPATADMVMTYQVSGSRRYVEPEEQRVGAPSPNEVLMPGSVQPPPASELPREQVVRAGTVVVFAEDPGSGRLVWRGLVDVESRKPSREAAVKEIVHIARHITREFPARTAAR